MPGMLTQELPRGRLLQASSILELRLRPQRLAGEIASCVGDCWGEVSPTSARGSSRRSATGAGR